ncbi:MAG: conjugal transfer protein TraG, partial [Deltaproteobacteria bacterium]|nr:conjugal transfer protein TraG [Deltaproteobacteria bacterium]
VTFFASECGDTIAKYISKSKYVSAAHAKGAKLPSTVFKEGIYTGGSNTIDKLVEELKSTIIPVPGAFVSLLADKSSGGSLPKFSNALNVDSPQSMRFIDCNYYLWVLVQGFRWEAGHIYNQVIAEGTDAGIEASQVVDTFLYGWRIGYKRDSKGSAEKLSPEDQAQYIINLILLHLFRNEWAMTPSPVNPRFSSSERSENYASAYMRNVGSKSKYGELYTWAKLMPFIQGVLLYILIAAYPFVCIVIVIPGWWKSMFTWMGFYAWAKSWDAGFAIVMSIERSIWAMLGNSSDAAQFNQIVASMRNLGQVRIDDGETLATAEYTASCAMDKLLHCVEPFVRTVEEQTMGKAIETLDKGLLMAARLDLDLANAYYIYIMSALYFAVPAITGQILLGAKAGASGMISTMVGGSAQEGGRGAGSSFTSEAGTRGHHAVASVNQAGFARELRQSGLAMGALTAGNQALKQDLRAAEAGTGNALNEQLQGYARMQQAWDDNNIKRVGAFKSLMPALKGKGSKSGSTGSSGEGTTGTESFKKPGLGSKIWSGISGVAQGINDGFNPASTLAETENVRDYLAANEAATAARMNMSIGSFEAQAMGKGYQITGNRYSSWGQQRAGEAQWRAARNFGTQVAGYTASLGISPAAFHAGSKPVHIDGMAGMGMLNTYGGSAGNVYSVDDARGTFIYPTDGYLQEVGAARSGLETLSGQIQKTFTVPGKSMGATLQQIMGAPFRPVYQAKTPHGVGRG